MLATVSYGAGCSSSAQTESNLIDQNTNFSEKPTRVNLQIDLENDSDNVTVYNFLREIESYNFRTTVYVTKEFALKFPGVVRDIRMRGHEIALHGSWENNLSYYEQTKLLNESIVVLRNISMQDIIHYRPKNYRMSYERDNVTFRAVQMVGLQTITAHITVNNSFPCSYSISLGRIGRPMHLPEGIIAIPISVVDNGTENIMLVDKEFYSSGVYSDYLMKKYNESSQTKEPMIIIIHPSSGDIGFQPFVKLLKHVVETKGLVATTSYVMGIANPYISGLSASGPASACKNEKTQISVSYTSNVWCPTYYFRLYGKYSSENSWQLLNSYSEFIYTGSHQRNVDVTIPKSSSDSDTKYTIRVVGRACRGGISCWPTYDSYEMSSDINIKIAKLCLLFVPIGPISNFDSAVETQMNKVISETNLASCPEMVVKTKVAQTYNGNMCDKNTCGLSGLESFVKGLGINKDAYDVTVGMANPCGNGIAGCSNGVDTIWISPDYDVVLAHELGHLAKFGGFTDQYCSKLAGSTDPRCNDGGPLYGGTTINYLDANSPYDCPPDGSKDSTGKRCCNFGILNECWLFSWSYKVCCLGNKANIEGGRSIMSYANAPGPRNFDQREKGYLNSNPKLKCPSSASPQVRILEQTSEQIYSTLGIELLVYKNYSVSEYSIDLVHGEADEYKMRGNDYYIEISDNITNVLWNRSFNIYFDYNGPVVFDENNTSNNVNYSNITYDDFLLTFKMPYNTDMKKINLYHNGTLIFSKNLTFVIGKIYGVVNDLNGTPITNALLDLQGPMFGTVHTNTTGEYQFIGIRDGSYDIFVTPSPLNNLFGSSSHVSIYGGQEANLNFTLQPAGTIAGYIINESEVPMTNVIVYTSGYETPRYAPNASGFYVIPELTTGIYTILVDASNTYYSDEYATANVTLGNTTWLNFTLKPGGFGALEGVVSAQNGTPVYGAYVTISGPDYRQMYTDANGRYKFTRIKNGTYEISVSPSYDSGLTNNITFVNVIPFMVTSFNITLPIGAAIKGFVFSYNGTPVYNAYVYISGPSYRSVYTNANGSYFIKGLLGGEYLIYVQPPYDSELIDAYVNINMTLEETSYINITLSKGGKIIGKVLSYNGTPVYNAYVSVSGSVYSSTYTDINGIYKIKQLINGTYYVYVNPPYDSELVDNSTTVNMSLGETKYVDIILPKGGLIVGRIIAYNGTPVYGAHVYTSGPSYKDAHTDVNGSYQIVGLVGGEYTIYFDPPYDSELAGVYATINVTLGETSYLNISLPKGGVMVGKVIAYNGTPVYDSYVYLEGPTHKSTYTNSTGDFLFRGLRNGVYRASASPPYGSELFENSTNISVSLGETVYLNIILPIGAKIIGTVVAYNGTPVYDVYVYASGPSYDSRYTDENGSYEISGLQAGEYTIYVDPPYDSKLRSNSTVINITWSKTVAVDFVLERGSTLTGQYSDYGLDTDGNGLYDYLIIEAGVNITKAGYYYLSSTIRDDNGNHMHSDNSFYLDTSEHVVPLNFSGVEMYLSGMSGRFVLGDIRLDGEGSSDSAYDAYNTSFYNFTDFERPPAMLSGNYSDRGFDTDGDGLYDYLSVDVGVNVSKRGEFSICAYLETTAYYATYVCGYALLNTGQQRITLNFLGSDIFSSNYSGVFDLTHIYLYDKDQIRLDYAYDVYNTSFYIYTEFGNKTATCGVIPVDGCILKRNTTFIQGSYYLHNGIEIDADNVILDCNGASLIGIGFGSGIFSTAIHSYNKNGITIKNCNITNYRDDYMAAIYLENVSLSTISNNKIYSNFGGLVLGSTSSGNSITKNSIFNNEYGVYLYGGSISNQIEKNNIYNNTYNLYNSQEYNITAEHNYWGTNNMTEIAKKIYDYYDDGSMGIVDYEPWLTAPVSSSIPGDVNGDCKVNIFDLATVGLCFGRAASGSCTAADVRQDGVINIFDLATVGLNFGKTC